MSTIVTSGPSGRWVPTDGGINDRQLDDMWRAGAVGTIGVAAVRAEIERRGLPRPPRRVAEVADRAGEKGKERGAVAVTGECPFKSLIKLARSRGAPLRYSA